MNFYKFIIQAFSSIRANKLRSFLSTLWVIIGISSFVIMLAMWEGAKANIMKEFEGSADVITITKKNKPDSHALDVITEEVSKEIKTKVPWIKNSFLKSSTFTQIEYNNKELNCWGIRWVEKWYLNFKKLDLEYWNYFSKNHFENSEKVVIIGNKLVKNTFWNENPLWKKIDINWNNFIVIWLLKEKNWEYNYNVFIPLNTMKDILNNDKIEAIEVIVDNENNIESIRQKLNYFLFKKSFIEKQSDITFQAKTNKDNLKMLDDIIWKMTLLLWWIWAIALIVWWIWIMNIMLVSVTERTREIW